MEANPNFWRGQVAIDEVIFRVFRNADAMVAALKSGEIDAAHNVPAATFPDLETTEGIVGIEGEQGGFDYLVLNSYAGKPPRDETKFDAPHPALLDLRFRQAIAHAIDKETLVERVYSGIGTPGTTMSPSANPAWIPELTAEDDYEFDLEKAEADPRGRGLHGLQRRRDPRVRGREHRAPLRDPDGVRVLEALRRVHHRLAEGDRHRHDARSRTTTGS